jgi:hypothetical protein
MTQEQIERKFGVRGPASLMMANISGTVDIQTGDEAWITVTAVKQGGGDAEHTRIEMAQDDAGAVTIKTEYGESFWRFFGQRPCDVAYTVRAPRNTSLTLKCVSSTATVNGLAGQLDISTISGDLVLANLAGPIKINLVSAGLKAEKLAGAGDISTVSGKVALAGCNFPSLKLSTVSGAVMVETPLGEGPYDLHSVSGDLQLSVQSSAGCNVNFSTLSGRFTSNLPTTHSQQSGRNRHLQLQGGGATVKFDSISANLNIHSAQGSQDAATDGVVNSLMPLVKPTAPPAVPEPVSDAAIASAAKARQDILDRVAQGKLSVDDAVNLLRG